MTEFERILCLSLYVMNQYKCFIYPVLLLMYDMDSFKRIWLYLCDYHDPRNSRCFCSSFLTASCRSCEQNNENFDSNSEGHNGSERLKYNFDGSFNRTFTSEDDFPNSPDSSKSFGDTQLDIFHHRHGLLILHLVATMMFAPSVVAWFQV